MIVAVADALNIGRSCFAQQRANAQMTIDPSVCFFVASHTFNDADEAENWWTVMSDADLVTAAKMQHERGIYAHSCLPSSVDGPMICIWEAREPTTAAEVQAFIEGPAQTAGSPDARTTHVYAVDASLGGIVPPSAWPRAQAPTAETTGSFFWCEHTFEFDEAAEAFFTLTRESTLAALESPLPELLHHHCFLPTGPSATDPAFSVWESREPLSVEEFHAFIDGSQSPLVGATSVVHAVAAAGTPLPVAYPRRPGMFAGAMLMPLMDDSMKVWQTMMPFRLTRAADTEESKATATAAAWAAAVADASTKHVAEEEDKDNAALMEKIEAALPIDLTAKEKKASTAAVKTAGQGGQSSVGPEWAP
jgi:hypothetical protein